MKTSAIITIFVAGVTLVGIGLASPLFINTTIDEALKTILKVVQEVTKARDQPTASSNKQASLLCDQNMRVAFKEYVPTITDQEMGRAIASIFLDFGIEQGDIDTIAERLRGRRRERRQKH